MEEKEKEVPGKKKCPCQFGVYKIIERKLWPFLRNIRLERSRF